MDAKKVAEIVRYDMLMSNCPLPKKTQREILDFIMSQQELLQEKDKEIEDLKSVDFDKLMDSYTKVGKENSQLKERVKAWESISSESDKEYIDSI